jgi:serine/threonine protein kinase
MNERSTGGWLTEEVWICEIEHRFPYTLAQEVWYFASQIVAGLNDIHAGNIVHRDIKPDNAFLTASGEIRIGLCC